MSEAPPATHRGVYPQLRCVWSKRWQRLHCNGLFRDTYDSTDTLTAAFGDRSHLGHLVPSRYCYDEVGGEWAVFGWVLVTTAGTQLHDSLDLNVQCLQLLPANALRHSPAHVLHQ
jgi:hypothetical protein